MNRKWIRRLLAAGLAAVMLSCVAMTAFAGTVPETGGLTGSINAEGYNATKSTVDVTSATNAADLSSMNIAADAGETLVFDNVDFTGAKCLMMTAAIASGSAGKTINLYIDDSAVAANKIGTLTTNTAKVNDYDFTEQYASLTKEVNGAHTLIFVFQEATELELDWIKLTSYTGTETAEERDARMAWWREAKYGQFIHMGAYSYLGGSYNGTKASGYSEWIMQTLGISKEAYKADAAEKFNPKDFDAEKIVSDAKAAGQKYIIITTRHHEGFSIYNTQIRNFKDYGLFSDWNTYTGKDPVMELSKECARQGLTFGVYVSILDWHDPSQDGANRNTTITDKEAYKAQLKGQVKELIEDYGAKVFFFDGQWVSWWTAADGKEMYRYILSLDETCIVNDRVGKKTTADGDYSTPEQTIPDTVLSYDWESCVTMNGNWGYKIGDENWKTPQWIITSLLDVVSKGGNLLLNVGPDGDGVVQEAPINNMAAAGAWLAAYGEAVFGADANIFTEGLDSSIRVTTKTEANGFGKIYVSLLEKDPKQVGSIIIPGVENRILSVRALGSGQDVPWQQIGDQILLDVFDTTKQNYATVYEITVAGTPRALPADGNLALGKTTEQSTVYASATDYSAASMVDGDTTNTRWAPEDRTNGSYSPDPDPWAIVDLGEPCEIDGFALYEYRSNIASEEPYRCKSFTISASTDKENWDLIYSGTEIGAELKVELAEPVTARYLKIHNIQTKEGSQGLVSIYEWKIFSANRSKAEITIDNTAEKISAPSFTLTGTWTGDTGNETVQVQVRGETLPAFTVPAEVDREAGTWSLTLKGASVAEGTLNFTVCLCDESGETLAADTYCVEYMGAENQSAVGASANSEWSSTYSAGKLVDGNMSTRWAPKDGVTDHYAIIDLGSSTAIGSVALYEWLDDTFTNDYRCDSFKLSVSEDGETWQEVYVGGEIGEKLVATLPVGTTGQYLKIHDMVSRANPRNVSLLEAEIYPPVLSGTVAISGTAAYGQTLTADISGLAGGTGTVFYQWTRNGVNIPGATADTYEPTADDIGSTITVTVSRTVCTGMVTSTGVAVAAADMTGIEAFGYSGAYDGQLHGITLRGVPEGATVTYGTTEGTYNLSASPTYTDFTDGAQTVYYKVTKANCTDVTGSATVNITKKDITGATVGAFAAMTYTGSPQTPAAAVTIDGLTATGAWSNVTNVSDMTTFTASGNFEGTIAGQNPGMAKKTVDALDLTTVVTVPVKNDVPQNSITHAQYTGTIAWEGSPEKFLGGTAYTAVLALTATDNYTFTGVAADSFTHRGAATITNGADSGAVTIAFPATGTASVSSIAIQAGASYKTAYQVGDTLDVTGLVITATMDDETTQDINVTEAMVTGFDSSAAADCQTLTITYASKTTTYNISIEAAPVYSIDLDTTGTYTFTAATVGYAAQTAKTVTVTNDGTGATGVLTVELSGANADSFTLSKTSIDSLAVGNSDSFTVVPNTGLSAGTYTATVTVSGGNGITASFGVSFTVNAAPATYTITFNPNGGAVTPTFGATGADGKLASLPTPTRSGSYIFNGWYTAENGGTQVTTSTVFDTDATIYAQWTYTGGSGSGGSTTYTVTVPAVSNGTVTVSPKSASKGTTVTITVTPDEGYELDTLTVTDASGSKLALVDKGDGKYTFTMPASKVNIAATFTAIMETPVNPFTDVKESDYYYDAVLWAVENGITEGTTDTTFSPNAACTRAQMVTFLWRAAGSPAPKSSDNPFADVKAGSYYYNAVLWAVENGITNGTSADTFSPDAVCTRAQTVTFLYRAAGTPDVDAANTFTDVNADAYYADAVDWAVKQEITNGTGNNAFSPNADCTRGQIVTFLYRAAQ
ncbi:MAG: alpha-L-fucosidase [Oscillospiraceae bacterium]